MEPVMMHTWDLAPGEAERLQRSLSAQVIKTDQLDDVRYVAGVDAACDPKTDKQLAAVVVLDAHSLQVIETAVAEEQVSFPYMPGLFSFRELPSIVKALKRLNTTPDLIVCDGHGIAHPRRFGLACHLGVMFDVPAIGCGKTILTGVAAEPGKTRGDRVPLVDRDEVIGYALRTQDNIKPVYVSIGHRISLPTACDWILRLSPRYRLPETTRMADQLVRAWAKKRFTR